MTKLLLIPVVTAFLFLTTTTGCKRNDNPSCDTTPAASNDTSSITGTWEMIYRHNGLSGGQSVPACNGNRLVFKSDSTFKQYINWVLIKEGNYMLVPNTLFNMFPTGTMILFDRSAPQIKQRLTNTGKTMSIDVDAADGGGATYIRRN